MSSHPRGTTLRDGTAVEDRRLDAIAQLDPRNSAYLAVDRLAAPAEARRGKVHRGPAVVLDQGREGACVGFAIAAEAGSDPVPVDRDSSTRLTELARRVYKRAQQLDPWPETGPEGGAEGTSIQAGAAAGAEAGLYDEYLWATSVDELIAVLTRPVTSDAAVPFGPVIAGLAWTESLYRPEPDGYSDATGRVMGRHAILIRGVALRPKLRGRRLVDPLFRLRNSWSDTYGDHGELYLTAPTVESLLGDRPELMVPARRLRPAGTP